MVTEQRVLHTHEIVRVATAIFRPRAVLSGGAFIAGTFGHCGIQFSCYRDLERADKQDGDFHLQLCPIYLKWNRFDMEVVQSDASYR